jgi:hypothetical protein
VERAFNGFSDSYGRALHKVLDNVPLMIGLGALILASNYLMYMNSKNELAPDEDQGILFFNATGPRTATLEYLEDYGAQIQSGFETFPEYNDSFYILGRSPGQIFGGFKMKPVEDRERSQNEVKGPLFGQLGQVAGFRTFVFPRPSIPTPSRGAPLQFVITTDRSYEELVEVADQILGQAMATGSFMFLEKSIDIDRPTISVEIDRDRAGDLGISMASGTMMLGGFQEGAIDRMIGVQFGMSHTSDLTAIYTEPTSERSLYSLQSLQGVQHAEAFREVPARLQFEHRSYRTSVKGIQPDGQLMRLLDTKLQRIALPQQGVILTDYLAELLHIKPGDMLTIEILEGSRSVVQVPVAGLAREYLGVNAYMQREALNRLLKEGDAISGAWINVDPHYLKNIYT